ncbi:MAG: hypothetical protein ABWJ99_00890 [Caldimicrobium sp.]
MEEIDLSKSLLESFEDFQKILLYRRESLLNLSLSQLSSQLLSLFRDPSFILGDLFLEFLMRLSYALYLKSKLLLNYSEEEDQPEENFFEPLDEDKKREFLYLWGLSFDRVLEERVFLPKVDGFENRLFHKERGDVNLLIGIFLNYLERLKNEPVIKLEFSEKNIEDYLKELRDFIYKERFFTWEEFLERKGDLSLLEIIFYFLGLLFLVFYGECGIHQDERGIIQIFLRE